MDMGQASPGEREETDLSGLLEAPKSGMRGVGQYLFALDHEVAPSLSAHTHSSL